MLVMVGGSSTMSIMACVGISQAVIASYKRGEIRWELSTHAMIDIVEEPPADTISNGTPVRGINPVTPPILKNICTKKYIAVYGFIIFVLLRYAMKMRSEKGRIILVGTAMYFLVRCSPDGDKI